MERSILNKDKIVDLTSLPEAQKYIRELEAKLFDIRDRITNEVVMHREASYYPSYYEDGWDDATKACLEIIGEIS